MQKKSFYQLVGLICWLFMCGFFAGIHAQTDSTAMVKYTPEFKFNEGIFLNFEQVKNNDPLPKSRILTNVRYDDPDFFDKVLDNKFIAYFDMLGTKNEIRTDRIWGYSRNGILYIQMDDGFFRITIVGSICHFVATETVYQNRYYDPYYGYPYTNYYYYRYGRGPATYASSEMNQYILDFETGKLLEYDYESLTVLLMKDPELHDEYSALRKRKKKQLKFLYIRKFNERNPLYLPVNKQ